MPRDERLVFVGLFGVGVVLLLFVVAGLLPLMLLLLLLMYGRLIWMVVGIVRVTVLLGDDPGLLKTPELEDPLVRVGVGVVDGDIEYRLGNSRRPGTYGSILMFFIQVTFRKLLLKFVSKFDE